MHYRRARREREAGRGEFEACYTNVVFLHGKSKVGPTSSDVCEGHFFFFHIKEVTDKPHNHQQLCSSRAVFASLSQLSPCCFQQQQAAVSGEKALKKSSYPTCSAPNSRQRHNTSQLLGDSLLSVLFPPLP